MTQRILIAILLVAAIVLLLRTVIQSSGWLAEGFSATTVRAVNTTTMCPAGAQMYMYGGTAYCCDGRIIRDATTLTGSCRPATSSPGARPLFCSLGSSEEGVPNCLEIHGKQLEEEAAARCPTTMPNYVKTTDGTARCCSGPANADRTDCLSERDIFCNVAGGDNEFAGGANSCEFLRARERDATACPEGWGAFTQPGQGALAGLTVFGCSDNTQMCYSAATTARLQELGYDTTGMAVCKSS